MSHKDYLPPCVVRTIRIQSSHPLCASFPVQGIEGIVAGGGEYGNDDFNNY